MLYYANLCLGNLEMALEYLNYKEELEIGASKRTIAIEWQH
jgi:hypothetical protein